MAGQSAKAHATLATAIPKDNLTSFHTTQYDMLDDCHQYQGVIVFSYFSQVYLASPSRASIIPYRQLARRPQITVSLRTDFYVLESSS